MGLPDAYRTQRLRWTFRNWGDGVRAGEYWIAYSECAKPQQNRQVNNARFLWVWGTFPTMTVLLCGLQGSCSLTMRTWCWCGQLSLKVRIFKAEQSVNLGHVVIWQDRFVDFFFLEQLSCISFMLFGIHVRSLYWKELRLEQDLLQS